MVGKTLSHYRLVEKIGEGGMGEVFRAHDTLLGRDVALKVIPAELAREPERIRRFEQEARAAGALNHPNVCSIFDIGTHAGSPFVVMELLEGETLRERLNQGPLPARKVLDYGAQAAHGLAAAHDKGIVHRDLKPENLFVTRDGRIKVLDFGLAKLTHPETLAAGDKPISEVPTAAEAILGTVGYMSPEQVRGQAVDHRADVFALGAILYEMIAGKRAFAGATTVDTLVQICHEEPPPLAASGRNVPAALEMIVRHCLEKEPQERFQSARDLAFDLEALRRAGESLPSGTLTAVASLQRPARLGRTGAVLAALALAVVAASVAYVAGKGTGDRTHAERVSYTQLTVERGTISSARFAPDGKTVFYSAAWNGGAQEIFETRPGFPTSRAMNLAGARLLSISRSGTMAVALEPSSPADSMWGTLAEVPISGGMPRRILDRVLSADWTADGKVAAVARWGGSKCQLEVPPGHVLYESPGWVLSVRVSPATKWLAFVEWPVPPDSRGSVIITDMAGRVCARTREWNSVLSVAWSADGREVWFASFLDVASCDLRAMTPEGHERVVARFPVQMTLYDIATNGQMLLARWHGQVGIRGRRSPADEERELGWLDYSAPFGLSRDGRTLLFEEEGIGGGPLYGVYVRGMDGSPALRLGEGHACDLSPDGKWALAIHYGPPHRLLLLPTGVGDSTSLSRGTIDKYYAAEWLPDGKGVVFSASEAGHDRRTYVQGVGGELPRPITPEGISGWHVSPDGHFVAARASGGRLYVCPVAGGEPRLVAPRLVQESVYGWTADGKALYVGRTGPTLRVSRLDLETGRRVPWRTFSIPDSAGVDVWTVVVTPDGQSYAYGYARRLDDLYLAEGLQ